MEDATPIFRGAPYAGELGLIFSPNLLDVHFSIVVLGHQGDWSY